MSEIVKLRTRTDIDEEAAVWVWRMDSAAVAAADRQACEAWLRHDPRHRRAAAALSAVWSTLDGLAEAKRDEKIATFTNTAKLPLLHHPQRGWFAAAAVLAAVAVGAIWLQQGSGESQTLATAVGQQRNVTLADGSTVTLNTNTILETDLRRRTREIYLRKGEAHFQVAHDRASSGVAKSGRARTRGRRDHRACAQCGRAAVHRQPRLCGHPHHCAADVERTRVARRRHHFRRSTAIGGDRRDRALHRCPHRRQRSGDRAASGRRALSHGQRAGVL